MKRRSLSISITVAVTIVKQGSSYRAAFPLLSLVLGYYHHTYCNWPHPRRRGNGSPRHIVGAEGDKCHRIGTGPLYIHLRTPKM